MSHYTLVFTDNAENCLLDIAEYIAEDNPVRAESFIAELADTLVKTLSIFPHSGGLYEGIEKPVIRTFPSGNYTSYYEVDDVQRRVIVHYIFHSKRKIDEFIKGLG